MELRGKSWSQAVKSAQRVRWDSVERVNEWLSELVGPIPGGGHWGRIYLDWLDLQGLRPADELQSLRHDWILTFLDSLISPYSSKTAGYHVAKVIRTRWKLVPTDGVPVSDGETVAIINEAVREFLIATEQGQYRPRIAAEGGDDGVSESEQWTGAATD